MYLSKDCCAALAMTIFFILPSISVAQTDTIPTHGTIKVGKPKKEKVYIRAAMKMAVYDYSTGGLYPPFPGVEGYTFPFNYTRYFNEKFKGSEIDLHGKATDTVRFEIKVLKNGKVYVKDITQSILVKNIPSALDGPVTGTERSRLQLQCFDFIKEIKSWEPAYIANPEKGKFKNQTVIKPNITQLTSQGILTIVFSITDFEEDY